MSKLVSKPASREPEVEKEEEKKGVTRWLKRLGVVGFLFFLGKGILWLFVGASIFRFFGCEG